MTNGEYMIARFVGRKGEKKMDKRTAKTIAKSGITVGQIQAMLRRAYDEGAANDTRSHVNSGISRGIAFNIFWGAYEKEDEGHIIKGLGDTLGATNALREFGEYWGGLAPQKKKRSRRKASGEFAHQEAINIYR